MAYPGHLKEQQQQQQ